MPHPVKEEGTIERVIRGLLKLPENRRCINCNSLGPQYICTNFWIFVCTSCSGVHREFTHRVKSVSVAKFNAEEVSALQAGGNERARQIYFKAWDPQRHSFPDGSNLHRLRDFIKHVYVDRKFACERSVDKLPMVKVGAKEDYYEQHSIERSSTGARKDGRKYYVDERRSPRYKQENLRSGGTRSRPLQFEIVDDRFRDDGFGSGGRSDSCRLPNAGSRAGSRSPDSQKKREMTSPPVVRSVREILGENIPHLQVSEPPKENVERDADDQKAAASSSPGSVDGKPVEHKRGNSVSLIDFSTDPDPSDTAAASQPEKMASSIDDGNLALVQSSTNEKASDAPNASSLESILFQLSAPAVEPVDIMSEALSSSNARSTAPVALSNSVIATVNASITNVPVVSSVGGAPATSPVGMAPALPSSSGDSMVSAAQQLPTVQQHQTSTFPSGGSSCTAQETTPSVGALDNQSWTSLLAPNTQRPSNASAEQFSQAASKLARDTSSGAGSQALLAVDMKSNGRKELPADLFTASYPSFPAAVPSWQMRPPHGMQYHPTVMPVPTFPNSAKSTNPFDLSDDSTQVQAPMFPSMSPLQGALPNTSAPTASFSMQSPQLMQPQSLPYPSVVPPQSPSFEMSMSPSAFTGQQLLNNMPLSRPQGIGGFGGSEAAFGSLNTSQQSNGTYTAPATPLGGNPFG